MTLNEIYNGHNDRLLNKWGHFLPIYENYFAGYRNREITLLEFGIAHGGSLQLWRKFFGPDATIIGVDVNPECKKFEEEGTTIYTGSQEDEQFLEELKTKVPKADILIDDGGHTMKQQLVTFHKMFDHVKDGGLYICEDTHTSYWPAYFGGYKRKGTFIEFAKGLVDDLHGWHYTKGDKKNVTHLTRSIRGLHFYDSVVIIEKGAVAEPANTFKGDKTLSNHFEDYGQKIQTGKSFMGRLKSRLDKK